MIIKQEANDTDEIQPEKHQISIYMQKYPQKLSHKYLLLTQSQLHSLRTLKKKILNQFQYQQSQGKQIQLHIMKIYPNQPENYKTPIKSQQNLKLIIDFLLNYARQIHIIAMPLVCEGELVKKQVISQQAIDKGEIHFDQNGSLIEQTDQMHLNIPQDQKYDNLGHIRCQFCQQNCQNKQYLKRCGGFYGPFQKQSYVHLLCALWCHQVFLDDNDFLQNVDQQIKRASNKKCCICKEKGAGLQCVGYHYTKKNNKAKCTKNYHFKCAYDSGCLMNWITFKMLCPKCKQNQDLISQFQSAYNKKHLTNNNHSNSQNQNQNNNSSRGIKKQQHFMQQSQNQNLNQDQIIQNNQNNIQSPNKVKLQQDHQDNYQVKKQKQDQFRQ